MKATREFVAGHPWRTVGRLVPLGIAVMFVADWLLGARAEFFNAVHLVQAWGEVVTGGSIGDAPAFLIGQETLGAPAALTIGSALLVVEPTAVLAIVVLPISWLLRRPTRRPSALDIRTEIDIAATPAEVWDVLVDLDGYQEWNPYHVRVDGDPVPGERLVVHVEKPNGDSVVIKPHVLRVAPMEELTWGGGIRGIFRGEHRFLLDPIPGGTRLRHTERFDGFAVRYAGLDAIEEGYEQMNRALKTRVERARSEIGTGR